MHRLYDGRDIGVRSTKYTTVHARAAGKGTSWKREQSLELSGRETGSGFFEPGAGPSTGSGQHAGSPRIAGLPTGEQTSLDC